MSTTTNFSVQTDSTIRKQCEALYGGLGSNLSQSNQETIAAMLEAERIVHDLSVKRYFDVEEALRILKE